MFSLDAGDFVVLCRPLLPNRPMQDLRTSFLVSLPLHVHCLLVLYTTAGTATQSCCDVGIGCCMHLAPLIQLHLVSQHPVVSSTQYAVLICNIEH